MPIFLDQHEGGMAPEMVEPIKQKVAAGEVDEFGAKPLNVFWSSDETFCLSDAPNADAVHKSHEAIGINLKGGAVRQVSSAV
jgi:hypothetical protein